MSQFLYTFGRFSVPTVGHLQHIQTMKAYAEAKNLPYAVYVSEKTNVANPLPVYERIALLKQAIPNLNAQPAVNMFSILDTVQADNVMYFTGGDYKDSPLINNFHNHASMRGKSSTIVITGNRTAEISSSTLKQHLAAGSVQDAQKISAVDIGVLQQLLMNNQ